MIMKEKLDRYKKQPKKINNNANKQKQKTILTIETTVRLKITRNLLLRKDAKVLKCKQS